MTEEMVDIVDKNDNVTGTVPRSEMRAKNLPHRGSAVLVFNTKGELLVHKRTMTKDIFPGYYDLFFGGVMSSGEDYDENIRREMEEELGISGAVPDFLFKFRFGNEDSMVFVAVYRTEHDGPFKLQKEEVEKAFFLPIDKARKMTKAESFCPDGVLAFNEYLKRYHK